MYRVSNEEFEKLLNESLVSLPKQHIESLKNVALIVEDLPSDEQRFKLKLAGNQTLLGLYEGLPLSRRQGTTKILPDKITLFKLPLEAHANTLVELKEQIRHTLWHEIAHYYGLDHDAIRDLE
jgi:predicted Zn-dependent protease with MMP-like domain